MTYGLTNPKYIQDLITTLPISKIEDIAISNKNEMSTVAKQVIKQLRDSQKFIRMNWARDYQDFLLHSISSSWNLLITKEFLFM